MENHITTAEQILQLSKTLNIKQAEIARRTGQSRQSLKNRLNTNDFYEHEMRNIATALGCKATIEFTLPQNEEKFISDTTTTSEQILKVAKRLNIVQAEIARRTGQSKENFYNKIKRNDMYEHEIRNIATAMGCKVDIVFTLPNGERFIPKENPIEFPKENEKGYIPSVSKVNYIMQNYKVENIELAKKINALGPTLRHKFHTGKLRENEIKEIASALGCTLEITLTYPDGSISKYNNSVSITDKILQAIKDLGFTKAEIAKKTGQMFANLSQKLNKGNLYEDEFRDIFKTMGCDIDITFILPKEIEGLTRL